MGNYRITCVRQYEGVITSVGIGGKTFFVSEIIKLMSEGHTFYTYETAYTRVHRKWSSISERWFLTTNPDSYLQNNLDFLPRC